MYRRTLNKTRFLVCLFSTSRLEADANSLEAALKMYHTVKRMVLANGAGCPVRWTLKGYAARACLVNSLLNKYFTKETPAE